MNKKTRDRTNVVVSAIMYRDSEIDDDRSVRKCKAGYLKLKGNGNHRSAVEFEVSSHRDLASSEQGSSCGGQFYQICTN